MSQFRILVIVQKRRFHPNEKAEFHELIQISRKFALFIQNERPAGKTGWLLKDLLPDSKTPRLVHGDLHFLLKILERYFTGRQSLNVRFARADHKGC